MRPTLLTGDHVFVKRIIGIPGDRIRITASWVTTARTRWTAAVPVLVRRRGAQDPLEPHAALRAIEPGDPYPGVGPTVYGLAPRADTNS